jgi:hypothetical protein
MCQPPSSLWQRLFLPFRAAEIQAPKRTSVSDVDKSVSDVDKSVSDVDKISMDQKRSTRIK